MRYEYNDGGRAAAGYKGNAGDCVTRAISIIACLPYQDVYETLAELNASYRGRRRNSCHKGVKSARNGVVTKSKAFKDYMAKLGYEWTPTMFIGQGCKVHLREDELPTGRLIVAVSKHYTSVINGVIHDTFDPQRLAFGEGSDKEDIHGTRCVYGYWSKAQ